MIELANGCYGYLPTPEQHQLGGYETWLGTNKVEIEASTKLTAALLEMLGELKAEKEKRRAADNHRSGAASGVRLTDFSFHGPKTSHLESGCPAKIEICKPDPRR